MQQNFGALSVSSPEFCEMMSSAYWPARLDQPFATFKLGSRADCMMIFLFYFAPTFVVTDNISPTIASFLGGKE